MYKTIDKNWMTVYLFVHQWSIKPIFCNARFWTVCDLSSMAFFISFLFFSLNGLRKTMRHCGACILIVVSREKIFYTPVNRTIMLNLSMHEIYPVRFLLVMKTTQPCIHKQTFACLFASPNAYTVFCICFFSL